jgi:PTH1 family peptidyl-tRNA hydrolase
MHIVVGLGNPSSEYEGTRHNTGRMAAALVGEKVEGVKVLVPDTFMNKTGPFVAKHVKTKKAAEKLIVIYDDLDLPLGTMKVSYNRGSGGHNGLESVIKALKTREFIRIRVGIAPTTPSGKLKPRPSGGKELEEYILGEWKPKEMDVLKKVFKSVVTAVETIKEEGVQVAMTEFNS